MLFEQSRAKCTYSRLLSSIAATCESKRLKKQIPHSFKLLNWTFSSMLAGVKQSNAEEMRLTNAIFNKPILLHAIIKILPLFPFNTFKLKRLANSLFSLNCAHKLTTVEFHISYYKIKQFYLASVR